jgi:adenylate kinase family enzyme
MRVHITGASGSGTTTLGFALSERLGITHFDTDDYYWMQTDPGYVEPRPMPERLTRLTEELGAAPGWILSGSMCGWGDPILSRLDLVVFLYVETGLRMARLRERERREYGEEALAPGGRMHGNHVSFLHYAASYDYGDLQMRSLARHDAWLADLSCPVLRFEGDVPTEEQVAGVVSALEEQQT